MKHKRLSGAVLAAACVVLTTPGAAHAHTTPKKAEHTQEPVSGCTEASILYEAAKAQESTEPAPSVSPQATLEQAQPLPAPAIVAPTPAPLVVPAPIAGTWLTAEHMANAAAIIQTAKDMGLPRQAWEIGIATAIQESTLVNLNWGDRDSLGLFQQRPSMGWGTPEQIMDPTYSARAFFNGLIQVPGWESMPLTVAAQTVQVSAYPDLYAQHETISIQIVDAFVAAGW